MYSGIISNEVPLTKSGSAQFKFIQYSSNMENLLTYDGLIIDFQHILDYLKINNDTISSSFTKYLLEFSKSKRNVLIIFPRTDIKFNYIKGIEKLTGSLANYLKFIYPNIHFEYKKYSTYDENRSLYSMKDFQINDSIFVLSNVVPHLYARKLNDVCMGYSEEYFVAFVPYTNIINQYAMYYQYLNKYETQENFPEWFSSYKLLNEEDLIQDNSAIDQQINELNQLKQKNEQSLSALNRIKSIMYRDGDFLQNVITEIFVDFFGFKQVKKEVGNEDDLIIEFQGNYLVIEIKGLTKSITSKHIMQTVKWRDNFVIEMIEKFADIDNQVKSCIICNPMRLISPKERVDEIPLDTLKVSKNHSVSILKTITVLEMYTKFKQGSLKKETIFESLFSSSGLVNLD